MSRSTLKPQKPSNAGKHRPKKGQQEVEVTFQDETANFKIPTKPFHRTDPKVVAPNLAFVNLTGSSGPTQDAGKRKLVRAHVMREFQREKQEKEHRAFEQWKIQNQRDPKTMVPSVRQLPDPDAVEWDDAGTWENQVEVTYGPFQWGASLPYQPHSESDIFGQQISEWTPGFSVPTEDDDMTMGNMTFEHNDLNLGFNLPSSNMPDQVFDASGSFDFEDEELAEVTSEQIECPLISNSINNMTRDSASFNAVDPFDSMPGLRNSRAQAIMYHYNKILMPTLISVVDPEGRWFNYAITDTALFHGTMLHSAAHNSLLSGNTDLVDPIHIKWEATKLVNQRLGDPVMSISDVTMGAVVCLVLYENQSGNTELSNIHMNGLRQMVNLRGGIQNLGLAGVLQRKILWADLCNATLTRSNPQFNLLPEFKANRNLLINAPFTSRTPSPAFRPSSTSCGCDKTLSKIISSLCSLSNIVSNEQNPKLLIVDKIYLIERQVVILLADSHSPSCSPVNQAAFIACLIYIYIFLRDFPLRSPLFGNLVERLAATLFDDAEEERVHVEWTEDRYQMLLWVLVIGALVSEGSCERDRFVVELKRVCGVQGVDGFEDFEKELQNSAWLERKALDSPVRATPFLRTLWNEVQLVGVGQEIDVAMMGMMDLVGGL